MFDSTRTIRLSVALVCSLFAGIAGPGPAAAHNLSEAKFERAVSCGHRFVPGPIVDGHNRQPTRAEFEARMQELNILSKENCRTRQAKNFVGRE